jgi:hypothetical protein
LNVFWCWGRVAIPRDTRFAIAEILTQTLMIIRETFCSEESFHEIGTPGRSWEKTKTTQFK